jgi:cytochrome c551/c552
LLLFKNLRDPIMRKKFIAGNWKMYTTAATAKVLAEGVACEACHGPSSKYINDHSNPKWRTLPFQARSAEYGMTMVRDPLVRAKACLSCHIGDAEQGKLADPAVLEGHVKRMLVHPM